MNTYHRNNHQITKEQIEALKDCNRLSINYYNDAATMTAHIDISNKYGTVTQEIHIPVNIWVKIYKSDSFGQYTDNEIELTACNSLIYNYESSPYIGTLAQLMKPGDIVEIEFIRQSNGYSQDANLYIYDTRARILRTNKAGEMHTSAILALESVVSAHSNYSAPIRFYTNAPAYSEAN